MKIKTMNPYSSDCNAYLNVDSGMNSEVMIMVDRLSWSLCR